MHFDFKKIITMKKILLISVLAFASMVVGVAQNEYKLAKGNVSTELQFSLFNLNLGSGYWGGIGVENTGHFIMPGLRMRYAITDRWAFRTTLGFDFGHNSDKTNPYEANPDISGSSIKKNSYTNFSVLPGIEYHFGKWERMSIYVGGELLFGINTTKSTYKSNFTSVNYWGGTGLDGKIEKTIDLTAKNCDYYVYQGYDFNDVYRFEVYTNNPNGNMAFGINAFTGIDFYVYKGLYLGAELGLGYIYRTALKGTLKGTYKGEVTYYNSGKTPPIYETEIDKECQDKISSGNFAFKCNPMIRLGWRF